MLHQIVRLFEHAGRSSGGIASLLERGRTGRLARRIFAASRTFRRALQQFEADSKQCIFQIGAASVVRSRKIIQIRSREIKMISVIMTNYNYGVFAQEAVNSVLRQDFADVKRIIQ